MTPAAREKAFVALARGRLRPNVVLARTPVAELHITRTLGCRVLRAVHLLLLRNSTASERAVGLLALLDRQGKGWAEVEDVHQGLAALDAGVTLGDAELALAALDRDGDGKVTLRDATEWCEVEDEGPDMAAVA
jgi:hypothetical protein